MRHRAYWAYALLALVSLATQSSAVSRRELAKVGPTRRPPSPRPSPPPPPPPTLPPSSAPPQYYIHFGKCGHELQQQQYGNWVMTRSLTGQKGPGSLTLILDTKNVSPVAQAFGTVDPLDFPMQNIYFAYFNKSGIQNWSPELDRTPYKESPTWYSIKVNGKALGTMRDLKDSGNKTRETSVYSLKGTINGAIYPSASTFQIEIVKVCRSSVSCDRVPDPATVFTAPTGLIVWSIWSVKQALVVNGVPVRDHAWCPVQTAINLP